MRLSSLREMCFNYCSACPFTSLCFIVHCVVKTMLIHLINNFLSPCISVYWVIGESVFSLWCLLIRYLIMSSVTVIFLWFQWSFALAYLASCSLTLIDASPVDRVVFFWQRNNISLLALSHSLRRSVRCVNLATVIVLGQYEVIRPRLMPCSVSKHKQIFIYNDFV